MNIRNFKKSDFEMIKTWWNEAQEMPPTLEMLPEDTTFILEVNNEPQVCITVYLTNTNYVAYLENFVKNPNLKENSKQHTEALVKYAEEFCKDKGFKVLVCLSYKKKLETRYQDLGYINTLNNISSFVKEV